MKVDLKKEKDNVVTLDIQVPAKDAENEYNKAVRKVSEYVNIPGFRKGKAPRNIVEKHVGIERIQQEALERMLPAIFKDAITKNDLDIVSQPYVESYDFNLGEDLKIVAKVELRPEIKLGEYKGLKLEAQGYTIPEDAFDKALEGLLQQHVKYELVVGRPAQKTDIVVIDFDGSVNGEKIKGGAAENYPLDLANSNFIPGFAEQLIGKNLGEEFDIEVKFPEEYHEAKLAGQPAIFKIKIKEIKEKVLPELTDEFAQKLGTFKTVEDLKADIQKYLEATKNNEDAKIISNTIFEKVLSGVKIDIQNSMVERETQSLLEEYKQRLMMQGIEWQKAVESQGEENILKGLKEEALLRIKNSLVIDEIAKVENIKIGPEELDKKLKEIEDAYKMPRAELMKQLSQNPQVFSSLSQQALNEKVAKFLNENNTVELAADKEKKAKSAKKND
ncbi:MAG TPA: trigger factor [Candidatus Gastranaerophilaceae bacterium]|nr:trigger factor [Candidatus Gastranaerophilaceae bacterium]